jgi:hypothetical protein
MVQTPSTCHYDGCGVRCHRECLWEHTCIDVEARRAQDAAERKARAVHAKEQAYRALLLSQR